MPDEPVEMTFVTTDVVGGTWLMWGDSITNVSDMVEQAIKKLKKGQCIGKLIICSHGADKTDGFMAFDSETSGVEVINGGSKEPLTPQVKEQLERLRKYFCPDALIEFRVCRFGAGENGGKAMQAVADACGVNVTAPEDSIKGVMGLGGIATKWATAYPSSTGIPISSSFWKGKGYKQKPPDTTNIAEVPKYIPMPGLPAPAPPGPAIVPQSALPPTLQTTPTLPPTTPPAPTEQPASGNKIGRLVAANPIYAMLILAAVLIAIVGFFALAGSNQVKVKTVPRSAATSPRSDQSIAPARDQSGAPAGPFNVYLELASQRSRGKDCLYRLGLRLQWPQSPPYKPVKGQTAVVALTGPGVPPRIEVQLVSQGAEYVENVVSLTNSNLGTFTATLESVGGSPIDSVAADGSRLTSSADNPCAG